MLTGSIKWIFSPRLVEHNMTLFTFFILVVLVMILFTVYFVKKEIK